jgi:hypothetical protein
MLAAVLSRTKNTHKIHIQSTSLGFTFHYETI